MSDSLDTDRTGLSYESQLIGARERKEVVRCYHARPSIGSVLVSGSSPSTLTEYWRDPNLIQ